MIRSIWKLFPLILLFIIGFFLWRSFKDVFNLGKKEETTITHTTLLQEIERLGKLELVKYHFKDVVEFEKEEYDWLPSSKVVLIAGGEAVGCIDLTKIKDQDVVFSGDTVLINLPPPELCYFKIDHEKSKVYSLQYTYFQDKNLIDQAYKAAEGQLKKAALNLNILEQTRQNAEIILKPILERVTNRKVVFLFDRIHEEKLLPQSD